MTVRYLKGGLPKILPNHLTADAKALRQAWDALVADLGEPTSAVVRWEMVRTARLWTGVQERSRELEQARSKHQRPGGGRRPSADDVARLQDVHDRAEDRLAAALDRLRGLAVSARPRDPAPIDWSDDGDR